MGTTNPMATVTVAIPPQLRARTQQRGKVMVSGETVGAVISALDEQYPGLRFSLCYETGELRQFVNIFVNGENVRFLNALETPVPTDATVHIFQSVAGG
jgi:molybdopterin synthase sulfur carrier subunit